MIANGTTENYKMAGRYLLYRDSSTNAKAKNYSSQYRFENFLMRP